MGNIILGLCFDLGDDMTDMIPMILSSYLRLAHHLWATRRITEGLIDVESMNRMTTWREVPLSARREI